MSTTETSREIGIVLHLDPMWVTQLQPAQTYERPNGQPYTVLRLGSFDLHFTSADDLERLHVLIQNAVIRQQMAEARYRRDREGSAA